MAWNSLLPEDKMMATLGQLVQQVSRAQGACAVSWQTPYLFLRNEAPKGPMSRCAKPHSIQFPIEWDHKPQMPCGPGSSRSARPLSRLGTELQQFCSPGR